MNADAPGGRAPGPVGSHGFDGEALNRLHLDVHAEHLERHPAPFERHPEPARTWCHEFLPPPVARQAFAVHEAAHAVLAVALGLRVEKVTVGGGDETGVGGLTTVSGRGNAQWYAVVWSGGAPASQRWLERSGYRHPELARCLTEFTAAGDAWTVGEMQRAGYTVDARRAAEDARAALEGQALWSAVEIVARLLLVSQALAHREVEAVVQAWRVGCPRVWTPSAAGRGKR